MRTLSVVYTGRTEHIFENKNIDSNVSWIGNETKIRKSQVLILYFGQEISAKRERKRERGSCENQTKRLEKSKESHLIHFFKALKMFARAWVWMC